jgi:chitinase
MYFKWLRGLAAKRTAWWLTVAVAMMMWSAACAATGLPPHVIVVYLDSWDEPATQSAALSVLASLPAYITVVDLAFARPDLAYPCKLDLSGTGLEFKYSGQVLHDAIALLRARNPDTHVLLSVGGSSYRNWSHLDERAVARLVHDLDADGVDIDFEPANPGCLSGPDQRIRCYTDSAWRRLVTRFRQVLARPYLLTAPVWSVGAYGEGAFRTARPNSPYTGVMLGFLRSSEAAQLDLICIDAYDAGPRFRPLVAFQAYRSVWPGALALGLEVQSAAGSGPFYTAAEATALAREVAKDPKGGMMTYPLLATPNGPGSVDRPVGQSLASAECRGLRLLECDASAR